MSYSDSQTSIRSTGGPARNGTSGIDLRDRPLLFGLLIATAFFLLAAGIIHLLAAGVHMEHAVGHGVFFITLGVIQITAAILVFSRPAGLSFYVAAAATGGILLLWVLTLFVRTPFGEEELDIYAITSKIAELAGFGTLIAFALLSRPRTEPRTATGAGASAGLLAILLVGTAVASAGGLYGVGIGAEPLFPDNWVHDHDHGHGHDHNGLGHEHGHGDQGHDGHAHDHDGRVHLLASSIEGVLPLTVNFTVHATVTPNATWGFDFGDGTTIDGDHHDFQETFSHTYEEAGEFTARFRVVDGNHSAEDTLIITVEAPAPMQASWEFGATDGCPGLLVLPCDGHDIDLADERYPGLVFTASASGTLAGDLTIDFLDAAGEVIESGGTEGTIPAGAVSAFLFTEGPSTSSTFQVELPPNVPEA